ncbi:MAG: acetylxylan esterase, partial [Candidatus Poribacteria bacterium]|nr:acetylxylan esterase [Candidatus Poribacteria bacterium]
MCRMKWLLLWILAVTTAHAAPDMIWDLEWAKTAPLEVEITDEQVVEHGGKTLIAREFTYFSHEWDGERIRIAGHLAMPVAAKESPLPGFIMVTSAMSDAKNTAATTNTITLAIDRVGEGGSTGPRDAPGGVYETWLAIDPPTDPRNSWMYHYVMSAVRAVTYLSSLEEVRGDRIGVTGVSRGGICSLLTSAVDDRIALSMPIAATGDFANTVQYEHNWVSLLVLAPTGRDENSEAWKRFVQYYDPVNYLDQLHGFVWIVIGAQDEFFPITSAAAMVEAANDRDSNRRIEIIVDGDHGYYGSDAGHYDTYNNGVEMWTRIAMNLNAGIRHVLHGDAPSRLPKTPFFALGPNPREGRVTFSVAYPRPGEGIISVELMLSVDGAWTFKRYPMQKQDPQTGSGYHVGLEIEPTSNIAAFVEIQYQDDAGVFFLTSAPHLSDGFTPRIRPP